MIVTKEAIEQMTAAAQQQSTADLCAALIAFDGKAPLDQMQRLTRQILTDVLTARHPEADAAFTAWATDEAAYMASTAEEAITRAALLAAGS